MSVRMAPTWVDVALGVLLAAGTTVQGLTEGTAPPAVAAAAIIGLSLCWRRRAPLVPAAVGLAVTLTLLVLAVPPTEDVLLLAMWMLGAYAVGAYLPVPTALLGLLLCLATVVLQSLALDGQDIPFGMVLILTAWLPGLLAGRYRDRMGVAEAETALLAAQQLRLAEQAVDRERARIARELHDVVAHALGIMVVQAGAAEQVLERDPARAREALAAVQDAGRAAVTELGRMLGLLREPPDLGDAPLPTLREVEALADGARAAGLRVHVEMVRDTAGMSPAVELSAYRVVQEALTNAMRYAPASTVWVRVDRQPDRLEIEVRDDGEPGPRTATGPGTGHGLAGLRERVAVFGGEFHAGPANGGGFRLSATLPTVGPAG